MQTVWISIVVLTLMALALALHTFCFIRGYGPAIRRIFEESPMFSPTEGTPDLDSGEVEFQTADGLILRGSYLKAKSGSAKGLIVFCHEFGANRWSGISYWQFLQQNGFDIFAFDFRNHGASDRDPAYHPRHWVTDFELADLEAAMNYLRTRPATRDLPIGLFGISRGGGTSIAVAARYPTVRCVLTDGAFPTHGTMLAYMRKWFSLVVGEKWRNRVLPNWYLAFIRDRVLARVQRDLGYRFARLERAVGRLAPRPILMIHGGRDSYIRPDIACDFFAHAQKPRELWIVPGARHNACLQTVGDEYRKRVLDFFRSYLT